MSTIRYVKIDICTYRNATIDSITHQMVLLAMGWHGSSDFFLRDGGCCMLNLGHPSANFRRPTSSNIKATCIFVLSCKLLMLFVDVYLKIKPSFHRCSRMVVWKMRWFWFVGLCGSVREMGVASRWHYIRICIWCEGTGYMQLPQHRDQ
jgi:hypothetical protein